MILLIAFVVVGPEDLPKVARWLGKQLRNLRLLLRDFREQMGIDEREREITSTKGEVNRDIRRLKNDSDLSHEVSLNTEDLNRELNETDKALKEE